ncbi:MAG: MmgE/PrpD family protein [Hyphomicrobiaceae bacterium]|nr:MmgE/PrpD family protein [Hyphomicrobiaceae bacterium]
MTTATSQPAASIIGNFIAGTRPSDLPSTVVHEAKRSLLNFVGCAIGVAYHPVVETAVRVHERFAGPRTATLLGRHERLDPLSASFVNAVAGNLLDYDDTHLRTVIHPTAPVAPPAIALAEMRVATGEALLTAFALGAEIECRLGNAVTGGHYARGWHITATCGVFGAAVAAGHLLGLSAGQIAHALGIAASQAAGVVENLPNEAKNVGMGNAARGGLLAALFAAEGYDAAPRAIEGPLGWARAAGDAPDLGELLGDLGSRWELLKNTYKPYPCGIVMHSIIDACLELRERHAIQPEAIDSVTVSGDALLLARGDRLVRNARDTRVSIHHSAAAPLLWGKAGVAELAGPQAMSQEAIAFRGKVKAALDASIPQGGCQVVVVMKDGKQHAATVLAARGSIEKPMTDKDIEGKVASCVAEAGTGLEAGRICAAVWELERAPTVNALLAATVARQP